MRTIAGRYELEDRVGSGGMGTVWKANDAQLQRTVAVKLLHEGLAADAAFAERFRREARAAASLTHPSVVTVYDTGVDADGAAFIVMEYIEGPSLHQVLGERGPLSVQDTARVARAILGALGHAHRRGLVHRDMKPANILQGTEGWKVADFGIAKGIDETTGLTRSGLIGTAAYLSPEQAAGHRATPSSDIYSVGCLLYTSLAGEPPFGGGAAVAVAMKHLRDPVPPLRARRPDVPIALESAILRALEKDPASRFGSAGEMGEAITAAGLHTQPSSEVTLVASPPTPTDEEATRPVKSSQAAATRPIEGPGATQIIQPPQRVARRRRRLLTTATTFLVAAALALGATLLLQNTGQPGDTDLEGGGTPAPLPTLTDEPSPEPSPTENGRTPRTTRSPRETAPTVDLPGLRIPLPFQPQPTDPSDEATPTPDPDELDDDDDNEG